MQKKQDAIVVLVMSETGMTQSHFGSCTTGKTACENVRELMNGFRLLTSYARYSQQSTAAAAAAAATRQMLTSRGMCLMMPVSVHIATSERSQGVNRQPRTEPIALLQSHSYVAEPLHCPSLSNFRAQDARTPLFGVFSVP